MKVTIEQLYAIYLDHSKISTDSRQIEKGCLFFALKGDNFDGNRYALGAIESGAAFAVIDNEEFDFDQALLVTDVLTSLHQLALAHRRRFNIPVVAITGSNGKTTTKELINAVLSAEYIVTATRGNLNNHIGVPLTLLGINKDTQIAIIEMGANHQGEIAGLCSIAEPTHGLITNIGRAHLGGFGGFEGVIKAKSELYAWLRKSGGKAFVNADNQLLMELTAGMERFLYGSHGDISVLGHARPNTELLYIDWESPVGTIALDTNLVGNYNFENVMAAVCTGLYFDIPAFRIKEAIGSYTPSNSRSQAMKTQRNSIILDAYNANPTSMKVAIENFRNIKAGSKMVILGDMLELGEESLAEHAGIVKLVEESGFDDVVLVGPDFVSVAKNRYTCFENSGQAAKWLADQNISNFAILVKGSRGIKMENVLVAL